MAMLVEKTRWKILCMIPFQASRLFQHVFGFVWFLQNDYYVPMKRSDVSTLKVRDVVDSSRCPSNLKKRRRCNTMMITMMVILWIIPEEAHCTGTLTAFIASVSSLTGTFCLIAMQGWIKSRLPVFLGQTVSCYQYSFKNLLQIFLNCDWQGIPTGP